MTLGDIIKDYRMKHGMSLQDIANMCGISKGYVAMLEKGINNKTGQPVRPSIEAINKISRGLGMDVGKVFELLDDDYIVVIPKADESTEFTEEDLAFLDKFKRLNAYQQQMILQMLDGVQPDETN